MLIFHDYLKNNTIHKIKLTYVFILQHIPVEMVLKQHIQITSFKIQQSEIKRLSLEPSAITWPFLGPHNFKASF